MSIGVFISKTGFFAFNSLTFWNRFIRSWYIPIQNLTKNPNPQMIGILLGYDKFEWKEPYNQPIIDNINFFKIWGAIMILVAIYVLLFQNEKYDRVLVRQQDRIRDMGQMLRAVRKFILNWNMLLMSLMWIWLYMSGSFTSRVSTVYLLEDLKYDKAKYSFILDLVLPWEFIIAVLFSNLIFKNSIKTIFYVGISGQMIYIVFSNLILYNYSSIETSSTLLLDILIWAPTLLINIAHTVLSNARIAYFYRIADPKLGSVHVTLLLSLHNLSLIPPITYLFRVVDIYALFLPNLVGCGDTVLLLLLIKPIFDHLGSLHSTNFTLVAEDAAKLTISQSSGKIKTM